MFHTKVGKRVGLSFYYGFECTRPRRDRRATIHPSVSESTLGRPHSAVRGAAPRSRPGRGHAVARAWAQTQAVSRPETCGGEATGDPRHLRAHRPRCNLCVRPGRVRGGGAADPQDHRQAQGAGKPSVVVGLRAPLRTGASGARGREPPHDGRNTPQADGGAVDLRQARPAEGGPRGAGERQGDGHGGGGDEASESAEALLLGLRALAGSAFAPRLRGAVEPPARQPGAAQSRDYSRVPSNGHGGE